MAGPGLFGEVGVAFSPGDAAEAVGLTDAGQCVHFRVIGRTRSVPKIPARVGTVEGSCIFVENEQNGNRQKPKIFKPLKHYISYYELNECFSKTFQTSNEGNSSLKPVSFS